MLTGQVFHSSTRNALNVVDRHRKLARLARGGRGDAEPDLNGPSAKPNRRALPDEGVRPEPARMRRERGRTERPPVNGYLGMKF